MLQLDRLIRLLSQSSSLVIHSSLMMGFTLAATLPTQTAEAAHVTKAKGVSVIIDLEGASVKLNDKVFATSDGKRKALIQIVQIKNGRALGTVLKGAAAAGLEVAIPSSSSSGANAQTDSDSSSRRHARKQGRRTLVGGLIGYSMDTQSVTAPAPTGTNTETVAMSGTGYSLKGLIDVPISQSMGLIGRFGIEQFNVAGTSQLLVCSGASCSTNIMYLSGDLLLRYSFGDGWFDPYVAAGLGLHFPISKTSNILNQSLISTTTVFFGEAGFYARISQNSYIPVSIDYGYFPPSNTVSTNLIALRAGYAFTY